MILKRFFTQASLFTQSLSEIAQISLLQDKAPIDIAKIWNEYHALRPQNVSQAFSSSYHNLLSKRMVESPFFLFPVRRRKSIFNLVCKSSLNSSLFYFYPDYDEDSEHNEPVFGLTYFDEFKLAKSLVLARGVIVNNFLSKTEADILLTAFMAHYCDSDLYEKYTKVFNLKKEEFDHEGFLENYFKKFVPIL